MAYLVASDGSPESTMRRFQVDVVTDQLKGAWCAEAVKRQKGDTNGIGASDGRQNGTCDEQQCWKDEPVELFAAALAAAGRLGEVRFEPRLEVCSCLQSVHTLRWSVPPKRASKPPAVAVEALAPVIKPLFKPLVEPVLTRLDRHDKLLEEIKAALDLQFKRTAAIQAQLDHLIAMLSRRGA